jgi:hypothetical protein
MSDAESSEENWGFRSISCDKKKEKKKKKYERTGTEPVQLS